MEYVPDAEPEYTDETVNVDCVLSWRQRWDAPGQGDVLVDFENGWIFDSGRWTGRAGAREKVLAALRRNQAGKFGGVRSWGLQQTECATLAALSPAPRTSATRAPQRGRRPLAPHALNPSPDAKRSKADAEPTPRS